MVGGVATAVLVAALTAIASGLGSNVTDWLTTSEAALVSYSVEELGAECGSKTFLPGEKAQATLRKGVNGPFDWDRFQHQPGAKYAEYDMVQVSIQGESARKIALTGIDFAVERKARPAGAVFSAPCGGPLIGRGLEVDVQANPPRVLISSRRPGAELGPGVLPNPDVRPISFPWTVSLTDPLLLYIVTTARSCACVWTAEISWASGGEHGAIAVDNGGRGFAVVGREGVPSYTISGKSWRRYE